MPTALPPNHIVDALTLEAADGRIDLFEISPLSGGTIYVKADNPYTWLGNDYEGLPMRFEDEERDINKMPEPQMQIGQEDVDLLPFKGLIADGHLEGGVVVRKRVLLDDMINQRDIKQMNFYRIKRVSEYSRTRVVMVLSSFSGAVQQTIPFRQYIPPAFPWVDL